MHALIFICYSTGLRLRAKKLAVFIKHMHYKKSSSLAESNFSKTKVLPGNQALNKNFSLRVTKWRKYFPKKLHRYFNISNVFQKGLISLAFVRESFRIFKY